MDATKLLELYAVADETPAVLAERHPALLEALTAEASARVAGQVARAFEDAPAAIRERLADADLGAVVDGTVTLRAALTATLDETLPPEEVTDAFARAGQLRGIDESLRPDTPLRDHPGFADAVRRAEVAEIARRAGVARAKIAALAERLPARAHITGEALQDLRPDGVLDADGAAGLAHAVTLANLTDGDLPLAAAIARRAPDLRSLAALRPEDWERTVAETPDATTETAKARALQLREHVAEALPTDWLIGQVLPRGDAGSASAVTRLGTDGRDRLAATLPHLGIDRILANRRLKPETRDQRIADRITLLDTVRDLNPDVELMELDLSSTSREVPELNLKGIPAKDRVATIKTLAAMQRARAVAGPDAPAMLAAGLHDAITVAALDADELTRRTGIGAQQAQRAVARARTSATSSVTAVGTLIDLTGVRDRFAVLEPAPDLNDYLRSIDGYATLFGDQDYCSCEECESILSPAAYFVDLMTFIEEHVTSKTFGNQPAHPLSLRIRRPDLWSLPLTCASTNDLVATLDLVNVLLENALAGAESPAVDLRDRAAVGAVVYDQVLAASTDSLRLPFSRSAATLDVLLGEAAPTRGDVARAVRAANARVTRADLRMTDPQWNAVARPHTDLAYLRRTLRMPLGSEPFEPLAVQPFLSWSSLTRAQLGDLLATRFVQAAATPRTPLVIVGERRDSESVQNDIERLTGANAGALDRLNRFRRLHRAIGDWTIDELDLALSQLDAADIDDASLARVAELRGLQRRLAVSVEDATVLRGARLPSFGVNGRRSLLDRVCNPATLPPGAPRLPDQARSFIHPAFRDTPDEDSEVLANRLAAGLGISAEDLLALIIALAPLLGADPGSATEADRGFGLGQTNITLLYRHARLASSLDLQVRDVLTIVAALALPSGAVLTPEDAGRVCDARDWLRASGRSVDDLAYLAGLPTEGAPIPDVDAFAAAVVGDVTAQAEAVVGDGILTTLAGVDLAQSAAVLDANPALFEPLPGGPGRRIARAVNSLAALQLTAAHEPRRAEVTALLWARHPARAVARRAAGRLGLPAARVDALAQLVAAPANQAVWDDVWAPGAGPTATAAWLTALLPFATALAQDTVDEPTLALVAAHPGLFAAAPASPLDIARGVDDYLSLRGDLRDGRDEADPLDEAALAELLVAAAAGGLGAADSAALAGVLASEEAEVTAAIGALALPAGPIAALRALADALQLSRRLAISIPSLILAASDTEADLARAATALDQGIRARYPDDAGWTETVEPLEALLREQRRDALVDYLTSTCHPEFAAPGALARYFLMDVGYDGSVRTTAVAAAIASAQQYVQRCRMNLEQDERAPDDPRRVHVEPRLIPEDEWSWRRHFRVWQVNRKVYLWPHVYIEPGLRDDKTPLFKELESTLLQREIDEQNVLDAYTEYLNGFDTLAGLHLAGAFHERGTRDDEPYDVLHIFGVATSDPLVYYYRTTENLYASREPGGRGAVWSPWRRMGVQIPVRDVAPVIVRGRLYLFWVEYRTRPYNAVRNGQSQFSGYRHRMSVHFTYLRLDGAWAPPQDLDLRLADYPFSDEPGVVLDPTSAEFPIPVLPGVPPIVITQPIPPMFDDHRHVEAQDEYTPVGPGWVRLSATTRDVVNSDVRLVGRNFRLDAGVDLRRRTIRRYASPSSFPQNSQRYALLGASLVALGPTAQFGYGIGYGIPKELPGGIDAAAELVLEERRIVDYRHEPRLQEPQIALEGGEFLGVTDGTPEMLHVAGTITDAIVQGAGDALLVQSTALGGGTYTIRRLGTMLADDLSTRLFTEGVDGLLDTDYQLTLAEPAHPIRPLSWRLVDETDTGRLDFTGPFGTYFREVFFHAPFLIANHLNSQGQYEMAQRWYHYIFDPTADEDPRSFPEGPPDPGQGVRSGP